jgi:hypothetical protein
LESSFYISAGLGVVLAPTEPEENAYMATQRRKNGLAEQLGTIAGTAQGTAEKWVNRQSRSGAQTRGRNTKKTRRGLARTARMADAAHAPGKRRRKPAPSLRGAKKSDERIPKMRTAAAARRRRKSYA